MGEAAAPGKQGSMAASHCAGNQPNRPDDRFLCPGQRRGRRKPCIKSTQGYSAMEKEKSPPMPLWFLTEGETNGHSSLCTVKVNMAVREVLTYQSSLGKEWNWPEKLNPSSAWKLDLQKLNEGKPETDPSLVLGSAHGGVGQSILRTSGP